MLTKICGLAQDISVMVSASHPVYCFLVPFPSLLLREGQGSFPEKGQGIWCWSFGVSPPRMIRLSGEIPVWENILNPSKQEIRTPSRTKSQAGWTRVMVNTTTLHIDIRCHSQQSTVTSLVSLTPPHEGSWVRRNHCLLWWIGKWASERCCDLLMTRQESLAVL